MAHRWSREDDIVAYYLYQYGYRSLDLSIWEISQILGMSESSMRMRIGNFKAIDGSSGLDHSAKLSREVYKEFKGVPEDVFYSKVIRILKQ